MSALERVLAAHRRRIKAARVGDAAAKGAFYASIAGCAVLVALKLAGATSATVPFVLALAVVPLVLAARAAARPFTIRDCAVHLDRALRLDERLSTAVESPGAMGGFQAADAEEALAAAAVPPRSLPREAKLLAGSGLLLLALMAIPAPEFARASSDAAYEEFVVAEAEKLEALADVDIEFKKAADLVKEGRPEEALDVLRSIERGLMKDILEKGDADGRRAEALDAATARAQAVSAELARLGRTIHAASPDTVRMKLERHLLEPSDGTGDRLDEPRVLPGGVRVDAAGWNPRYDTVIRNYFRSRRER